MVKDKVMETKNKFFDAIDKEFVEQILAKRLFYFPLLSITLFAFFPSITNTRRMYEDFNWFVYFGEDKRMVSGRWGLYLVSRLLGDYYDDILNKFLGIFFLMAFSIMVCAIIYRIFRRKGIIKYTILASCITTFPLISEVWSFNYVNFLYCLGMLLVSTAYYILLKEKGDKFKRILIATVPFIYVSSSYEAPLFFYVSFVLIIFFYMAYEGKITFLKIVKDGIYYAAPLFLGSALGVMVGKIIAARLHVDYYKYGSTSILWGERGAFKNMIVENVDRFFLRGLVYYPIFVFDLALLFFGVELVYTLLKKRWDVFGVGIGVVISLFFLSIVRCDYMNYRTAQTIMIFTSVVFFFVLDKFSDKRTVGVIVTAIFVFICVSQAAYLEKMNLLEYQNAHNDENMVREIGYDLTTNYYGKPVLFTGHRHDLYSLTSPRILEEVTVNDDSFNGRVYNFLKSKISYSTPATKFVDTSLYSVLYTSDASYLWMEQFFSYCGYSIDVLYNANIPEDYPEVQKMLDEESLHHLQIVDMGEYVLVNL